MTRGDPHGRGGLYRWPLLLAAATLLGLVVGLLGDRVADVASWLLLGGVLITALICYLRNGTP